MATSSSVQKTVLGSPLEIEARASPIVIGNVGPAGVSDESKERSGNAASGERVGLLFLLHSMVSGWYRET